MAFFDQKKVEKLISNFMAINYQMYYKSKKKKNTKLTADIMHHINTVLSVKMFLHLYYQLLDFITIFFQ